MFRGIVALFLLFICCMCRGGEVRLQPNAMFRLEFPELPDTLSRKVTGSREPARLAAQLPENYSAEGRFPLLVFLNGGDGGSANYPVGREILGPRDFICVNMPLFKGSFDTNEFGGTLITVADFSAASSAYDRMLKRLFSEVPNIDFERSVFGGASNGAHLTAVLLAGGDRFILEHFRSFILWEGGADILAGHVLETLAIKNCRFLLMHGDQPSKEEPWFREYYNHLCHALDLVGRANHLDWTSVVVRGYGHEFPSEYFPVIDKWVRREKLPRVNPK